MKDKFSKGDFLYMLLTTWLLNTYGDIYDEYLLTVYEEHAKEWRRYNE